MLSFLHKSFGFIYYKLLRAEAFKYKIFLLKQHCYVRKLRYKDKISIVFIAMNVPMWRYQELYDLMKTNKRFKVYIVLSPAQTMSKDQQEQDLKSLRHYFSNNNIPFIDFDSRVNITPYDIRSKINPDILFYPQPYERILVKEHRYRRFLDKLICYYPYAFWTSGGKWSYDSFFHNHAWKLFYSTQLNYEDAKKIAANRGRNVVVTGYPNADFFMREPSCNPWKEQKTKKKKVIWAPHFTIEAGITKLYISNFLWMADLMLEIAHYYSDTIQFAFKPHPRLKTELYKNTFWGKLKTDAYFKNWETMDNTQLETEEYIDLFLTSDAMIHDCSSFTVEYLYTHNPVLYICQDIEKLKKEKNLLGKKALDCHYIANNEEGIYRFLRGVVINGEDKMINRRLQFYKDQLLPPNGKSVAQNTMNDLYKSLRIE